MHDVRPTAKCLSHNVVLYLVWSRYPSSLCNTNFTWEIIFYYWFLHWVSTVEIFDSSLSLPKQLENIGVMKTCIENVSRHIGWEKKAVEEERGRPGRIHVGPQKVLCFLNYYWLQLSCSRNSICREGLLPNTLRKSVHRHTILIRPLLCPSR